MQWSSVQDFFAMGGDAFFVWGAYGAVLVALAAELCALRGRRKRALAAAVRSASERS